jgi:hypothetical protein
MSTDKRACAILNLLAQPCSGITNSKEQCIVIALASPKELNQKYIVFLDQRST